MEPTALTPILEDVARWSVWNEPRQLWFNSHLIRIGPVVIAIDPVEMTSAIAGAIDRWGRPQIIVVTNRDHERATAAARRHWDAQLFLPRADAMSMTIQGDSLLDDGDAIAGVMRAVAVRDAKSPGELAIHWPARRLLVLGDAAIGRPAGKLSLLPDDKLADVAAARAGVVRLAELDPEIILVGDGDDILTDAAAALASLGAGPPRAPAGASRC